MKERNTGVDLLRCVAMFMVLMLHLLLFSGTLSAHPRFSAAYETAWALEILAFGAVDVYALISGYIGCEGKTRYAGLAFLWLTVAFYSFGITLLYRFLEPEAYNLTPDGFFPPLVKAAFPVTSNQYWYFCSYFLMFLFLPLVNKGLSVLSAKQLKLTAAILMFALCVLNVIGYTDPLRVAQGYGPMWLLSLYVLGGVIRKTDLLKRFPTVSLLAAFVALAALTFLSKYLLSSYTIKTRGYSYRDDYLIQYVSPTVVGCAVCLLGMFSRFRFPKPVAKVIGFIAPSAFSVYLIHENHLVREFVMKKKFLFLAKLPAETLVWAIPVAALALFFICVAIDMPRRDLFRVLRIKALLRRAEERLTARFVSEPPEPKAALPTEPPAPPQSEG